MGWPQITLLVLIGLNLGVGITNHGKPRGNYNALYTIIDAVFLAIILTAGGFFG